LVDQLPPEQREVVILRHYADMSFKEIAQLTRVSINTALGRMRYALINIRRMMEEKQIALQ
jgi:RNA polymerase sigma-70 factor (ECF subfamily)